MKPGRSQTGRKIEIVNMFTWDQYKNHKIFNLFPLLGNFLVQMAFVSICCSNVKVTAKTGLKCICVYIHAGLNSCRSKVNRLDPAGRMTWDWSVELFSSRSLVNIYYRSYYEQNKMVPVWLCCGLMCLHETTTKSNRDLIQRA